MTETPVDARLTTANETGSQLTESFDLSVAQVVDEVRAGERSALELTDHYLDRIDAVNDSLNVYRTVMSEQARTRAAEIDAQVRSGGDPGPLAGVPIALKDNIAVENVLMTASSSFLRHHIAQQDAHVTEALRRAGAVILGKLHMSEWAIGGTTQNIHFGVGRNAWDRDRVPGGSSGGSGAAVAADLALVTLGTDTGGSIRLPASLNGVVGLRPTIGRVSNRGSIPVAWSFDTIGPLGRRAADVAAVLGVIAGYDDLDPLSADVPAPDYLRGLTGDVSDVRVGVLGGTFQGEPLTPDTAAVLARAVVDLSELGADIKPVTMPGHLEAIETTADLLLAEAAAFHAQRMSLQMDGFAPDVQARLRRGAKLSGPDYALGRQAGREWRRQTLRLLADRDVLLCPACPFPAPLIEDSDPLQMTGKLTHFSSVWGLAGVPALVVPAGFVDGLPVAMQLVGRPFEEQTLLRVAHAYQQVTEWHLRRPASPPDER